MKLVGLNGTTIFPIANGRISQYFSAGIFPYQWTWRPRKWKQALGLMPKEPYILTGFSAGATLCHNIGAVDENCKGIMVHSGLFSPPVKVRTRLPVLLLNTESDFFDAVVTQTEIAYDWYYSRCYRNLTGIILPRTTWHGHEYANGLDTMEEWCETQFNYKLPRM